MLDIEHSEITLVGQEITDLLVSFNTLRALDSKLFNNYATYKRYRQFFSMILRALWQYVYIRLYRLHDAKSISLTRLIASSAEPAIKDGYSKLKESGCYERIRRYRNNFIGHLSKQFVSWENRVKEYENSKLVFNEISAHIAEIISLWELVSGMAIVRPHTSIPSELRIMFDRLKD